MSNYTQTNNFTALTTAQAVINGAALDTEYGNISTAIASKIDNTSTGESVGNLNFTSATLPVNGLYLSAANSLTVSCNTTKVATFKTGLVIGAPTGGDQGVGTINVTGLFVNGVSLSAGTPMSTFSSSNPSITLSSANTGFISTSSGLTITIPANASVAFPIGTMLLFINSGGGTMSIAITTDTMTLASTVNTGTRSLIANGMATATKLTATTWLISGAGLS